MSKLSFCIGRSRQAPLWEEQYEVVSRGTFDTEKPDPIELPKLSRDTELHFLVDSGLKACDWDFNYKVSQSKNLEQCRNPLLIIGSRGYSVDIRIKHVGGDNAKLHGFVEIEFLAHYKHGTKIHCLKERIFLPVLLSN